MKILVTGATGFVGKRLCKALVANGHQCVAISRKPDRAKAQVPELTDAWAWQSHQAPPTKAFQGLDAVIHLAGEPVAGRWTHSKKHAIEESRVLGTQRLVTTLTRLESPPSRFICMSAMGHYGPRGDDILTESEPPGDTFLSKVTVGWEAAANVAADHNISTAILRLGMVLGHEGGAMAKMWLPFSMGAGGPLGSGNQWWSWIHIDDAVKAIIYLLNNTELTGPFNGTAPEPARQRDFAKSLGRAMGRPSFMPAPSGVLKTVLGGFSAEVLTSLRVHPKRLQEAGFEFQYPTIDAALASVVAQKKGA